MRMSTNALTAGGARRLLRSAMIFVDGTNLFRDLKDNKLKLQQGLSTFLPQYVKADVKKLFLYTTPQQYEAARAIHGDRIEHGVRVVEGDDVKKGDGRFEEKCVDALLVSDLIYHAAARNFDYALVVSRDTDFRYAIERVED